MIIAGSLNLITFHVWAGPEEKCKYRKGILHGIFQDSGNKTRMLSLEKFPLAN